MFNGISNHLGLSNTKLILLEGQYWYYYLTHRLEDKGIRTFLKGICPKMNVMALPGFELIFYDATVQQFNDYTKSVPLPDMDMRNGHIMFIYIYIEHRISKHEKHLRLLSSVFITFEFKGSST